jgi:hypothetical protein
VSNTATADEVGLRRPRDFDGAFLNKIKFLNEQIK